MATIQTNTELGRQIVEDAKRFVLDSWSLQDAISPIAVAGAEGCHQLVDELEGEYVVRCPDPSDRRASIVTDKGRACIAACITTIEGIEDRIIQTLGDRGHRQLRTLLRKLLDAG
jgi:hypothetical protein